MGLLIFLQVASSKMAQTHWECNVCMEGATLSATKQAKISEETKSSTKQGCLGRVFRCIKPIKKQPSNRDEVDQPQKKFPNFPNPRLPQERNGVKGKKDAKIRPPAFNLPTCLRGAPLKISRKPWEISQHQV